MNEQFRRREPTFQGGRTRPLGRTPLAVPGSVWAPPRSEVCTPRSVTTWLPPRWSAPGDSGCAVVRYRAALRLRALGAAPRAAPCAPKPRADYVLATKVGRLLVAEGADGQGLRARARGWRRSSTTYEATRRSLTESLERLGLEDVDRVHVHGHRLLPGGPGRRLPRAGRPAQRGRDRCRRRRHEPVRDARRPRRRPIPPPSPRRRYTAPRPIGGPGRPAAAVRPARHRGDRRRGAELGLPSRARRPARASTTGLRTRPSWRRRSPCARSAIGTASRSPRPPCSSRSRTRPWRRSSSVPAPRTRSRRTSPCSTSRSPAPCGPT